MTWVPRGGVRGVRAVCWPCRRRAEAPQVPAANHLLTCSAPLESPEVPSLLLLW